jgi:1,4-alpha-glucan branching enzyme
MGASLLTEFDLHLFGQGRHHRIYEKLGAHLDLESGVEGTRFAVWAPNATGASVVGPFNAWDGRRHPLSPVGVSGIWQGFVPGIGAGTAYKYEIRSAEGRLLIKSDRKIVPWSHRSKASTGGMPTGCANAPRVIRRPRR